MTILKPHRWFAVPSILSLSLLGLGLAVAPLEAAERVETPITPEVRQGLVEGDFDGDKGHLILQAQLTGIHPRPEESIYTGSFEHRVIVHPESLSYRVLFQIQAIQGALSEIRLAMGGTGEIKGVNAAGLLDWSVRQASGGGRVLVLRLTKAEKPAKGVTKLAGEIVVESVREPGAGLAKVWTLTTENPVLGQGFLRIDTEPDWEAQAIESSGLLAVDPSSLPETLRVTKPAAGPAPLCFRFQGAPHSLGLRLQPRDPDAYRVALSQFVLTGELKEEGAVFSVSALATVKNPKGGEVELLGGKAALVEAAASQGWRWRLDNGRFIASFAKPGEYPIQFTFHAAVTANQGWNELDFFVAQAALQQVVLTGLHEDTDFLAPGSAKPRWSSDRFTTFLPSDGRLHLSWRRAGHESEGALFYSIESFSQMAFGPGVLRQSTQLEVKIMQGELQHLELILRGPGEVTRLAGPQVLSWKLDPIPGTSHRKLTVELNQPEKETVRFQLHSQVGLGAFPSSTEVLELRAENAVRSGGYYRVISEGAVRLEILDSTGLSQISPDQIPVTEAAKALLGVPASQSFAFRFSGTESHLKIQADDILPEVSVSQLVTYHLGENELSVEAELELDIREAPLRELMLSVPKGYSVAKVTAPGLADFFLRELPDAAPSELRLVYGTPAFGRQMVQLKLERNRGATETSWDLPPVGMPKAKSTRGYLCAASDAGFRLMSTLSQGVSEMAPAFFPKKVTGIQSAFRLADPTWRVTLAVERLPQSVQVDAFHLFSVGEGIAYGSSLLNYVVSGAPVSVLRVGLSNDLVSVEFTGKEVRSWQKTDEGYLVQLQTPVSGSYTLLATYERPFKPQGETLRFTGARALDAQTEQGYSLVVSAFQFQVQPVSVSTGLIRLEPGEVPAEYRLLFDAPILAAYRYASYPYDLQLQLRPLALGDTVNQVIDRASLETRISKEGQVITEVQYFVKSKAASSLRLVIPPGAELWSVTVNGRAVVPVKDQASTLIPLPSQTDANAINELKLKVASKAKDGELLSVVAPEVAAPILWLEWKLSPDAGRRLRYVSGSIAPSAQRAVVDGFDALLHFWRERPFWITGIPALIALGLLGLALWIFHLASAPGVLRGTARHTLGGLTAFAGCVVVMLLFANLAFDVASATPPRELDLRFLVPVQQNAAKLNLQIQNLPTHVTWREVAYFLLPAFVIAALSVWKRTNWPSMPSSFFRTVLLLLAIWGTLRLPGGAPWAVMLLALWTLIARMLPAFRKWRGMPRASVEVPTPGGTAGATALWLLLGLSLMVPSALHAGESPAAPAVAVTKTPAADLVVQELHVEKDLLTGVVHLRWLATQGEVLPILDVEATLTQFDASEADVRVVRLGGETGRGVAVLANRTGQIEVSFRYQMPVGARKKVAGINLPTRLGVVNRLSMELMGLDVDLIAPGAVSVHRKGEGSREYSRFDLVLSPALDRWIGWQPRSRDTKHEAAVYYSEIAQLYVPLAGVVEGNHQVQIRPAQGELAELLFRIPTNTTVTDVTGPDIATWRFQPETRQLKVRFSNPQSKAFTLQVFSQVSSGPLPMQQELGLIRLEGAATEVGWIGLASGSEVQIDDVQTSELTGIHLDDFPTSLLEPFARRVPGIALRRAFRYSGSSGQALVKASSVQPDVRVETEQTLSLAEDRVVLAATLELEITRAGLFKVSFVLPPSFDVESISGASMSHWTEVRNGDRRVITLHLKTRTEGKQSFALSLVGPGVRAASAWTVPRISLLEATKQRGQLLIVPEQGLKIQPTTREGVTQSDPTKAGVKQKGVLAFRLLQSDWTLSLSLERIPAWTQVTSLQHVEIAEALVRVAVNLQFEIDHAGMSTLQVQLPASAQSVRFRGEQVADFRSLAGAANAETLDWEIKLQRRQIGKLLIQVNYTLPASEQATEMILSGIGVRGVNQHRGFVTVQSDGRLQARVDVIPPELQPTEWQSIPRLLQQDIRAESAGLAFRMIEPGFRLPIRLERHQAAQLLPAKVQSVSLTSVTSDEGELLTQVQMQLAPGDKQLLHVRLPANGRFWFAFVNQGSVWHWMEKDEVLIPLEHQAKSGAPIVVEFLYSSSAGRGKDGVLDLRLVGPKFDLPLENITWRVLLGAQWKLKDWNGSLQLQEGSEGPEVVSVSIEDYMKREEHVQKSKSQEAEQYLSLANNLLQQGDPEQARRAFRSAFGLSQHDSAFNEDARVQLHNLKTQQAMVGLNVRQAKVAGASGALTAAPRDVRDGVTANYTQQEAKQLLEKNSVEENAVQMRLVERLIQQQEAVMPKPAAIRPSIPEQGHVLTFTRALQVENWADMSLSIEARSIQSGRNWSKLWILAGLGVILLVLNGTSARRVTSQAH